MYCCRLIGNRCIFCSGYHTKTYQTYHYIFFQTYLFIYSYLHNHEFIYMPKFIKFYLPYELQPRSIQSNLMEELSDKPPDKIIRAGDYINSNIGGIYCDHRGQPSKQFHQSFLFINGYYWVREISRVCVGTRKINISEGNAEHNGSIFFWLCCFMACVFSTQCFICVGRHVSHSLLWSYWQLRL